MMKFLYKKHKLLGNKGFSLVELIIVIAIMAVLMAVLAPQLIKYVEKSRISADDTFMGELKHNVEVLMADEAIYDTIIDGSTVTWTCTNGTVTSSLNAAGGLQDQLVAILKAPHPCVSKGYKGDTYLLTFDVTNGVVTIEETTLPTAA